MRSAIDWKKRGRELIILVAIGTFLAIINPYGATSGLNFWQGWLYWTGLVIYGSVMGSLTSYFAMRWMEGRAGWMIWLVVTTVTALLVTPVLATIHFLLGSTTAFQGLPLLFVFVWVISAAMTGVGFMMHLLETRNEPAEAVVSGPGTNRTFMDRLPLPYRTADLYAISSEDHYLRIHTSAGEHLFLERLSTAIHLLSGVPGLQTHRSWWVAENGVSAAKSRNGRIVITLKSDVEVPVSRTYAKAVREAGWVS